MATVVNTGGYILHFQLLALQRIQAGRLGEFLFQPGFYAYVGSAMNGLEQRISRHLRKKKKLHWHIDYLLQYAEKPKVFRFPSNVKQECDIGRLIASLPEASIPAPGFGSSDCQCKSHLYFFREIQKKSLKLLSCQP